ncbi:hydrolase TatD [Sulfodiicoccus acidiphilus]|uniref:Hydrolase TatD n=1 Tax=Sulfodiicoccus acidiphilus TaxID=1670455 RepID=A0A348B3Z3_9CREN|nr:TatD family hydrolase [Sulfodiicoccus acidiphilus]BBD72895.1 hydrolase TatD [Sulfodiicoccus acidiphilus]GGT88182.1 hydrolase TatD [Sulfodiicoccus acidiphilus]
MLYDAHCHLVELGKSYDGVFVAAVSMDLASSKRTLGLLGPKILKGVGIHPWLAHLEDPEKVLPLIEEADFVGEVGLDRKYSEAPWDRQRQVFLKQIREDKTINVHALRAWKVTFDLLIKHDVKRAIFHWYTGPKELLKDIEGAGYFVTVNPSVKVQKEHAEAIAEADLSVILVESDGGYTYRGRTLEPPMVVEAEDFLATTFQVSIKEIERKVRENFIRAFSLSQQVE